MHFLGMYCSEAMKKMELVFIVACILTLSGCYKKKTTAIKNNVLKKIQPPQTIKKELLQSTNSASPIPYYHYKITTPDIECALCAQSVVEQLTLIPGVQAAEFKLTGTDYQLGYIDLTWHKNALTNITLINKALSTIGFATPRIIDMQ
jgi:copper chaperone CopZ